MATSLWCERGARRVPLVSDTVVGAVGVGVMGRARAERDGGPVWLAAGPRKGKWLSYIS
jgi:hypothetical protein